ncbi:hydrolase [Rudanella paleaurantiibacter]|uniref:Hydrolase n=1 Tax=Rudanella paleaurantiibacter TaxID=2614655 RepID=A0A7J5TUW0_9BACT|nr:carbohydrate binding family 9 domain-containing protein [Rudanella paleaurantiibacter]KAB7727549.1 hydrolase [Rudanella paleaurantiibacter]
MNRLLLLVCLGWLSLPAWGQKKNDAFQYHISRATSPIRIDGAADEAAWQSAQLATDFYMVLPMDTSRARIRTDVRMAYDDNNLYMVAICYHPENQPYVVESLRRDWNFGKNDNFLLFLDTFDDQTNGFSFGANAVGAQWDGLMFEGAKINTSWDNKWYSVVRNYPDRYVFEVAIPFKTIRYKKGVTRWGVNFSRQDLTSTEKSSWTPIPRQFPTASLAYTGTLVWDQAPPQAGPNISVIPYVLGSTARDFSKTGRPAPEATIGGDAKVALTSSLNLDLTVNPDFSQVEVDRQVTNLDRFELFFPERRQFFLENGDLFANFGYTNIRPFFSRRIGLGVPIRYGARLSGKLNKDWRIGVMHMQTGEVDDVNLPRQNFTVAALQRRVAARSNVGLLMINKQSMNYEPRENFPSYSQYNRNLGLEYNLASANNLWTGKALYLKSFSPNSQPDNGVMAGNLQYNNRKWLINGQYEYVGTNYNPEVGYVPRRGYQKFNAQIGYLFFPKGGSILSHGPQLNTTVFMNTKLDRQLDNEHYILYGLQFRNKSTFAGWVASNFVRLLADLDPTNSGKARLGTGTLHYWRAWGTEFVSRPQSMFTYGFSTRYGGFYDGGTRLNITTDMAYRIQPYASLALTSSYNRIDLPNLSGLTTFWLVGPRLDLTMTNTLFVTAFMQYNEQAKNVNLNTRVQWRYKPASDLFIVYTDNYLPENFRVKNRALVFKLTYWWNV